MTLFVRIWHELALGGGALEVLDAVMDGSMQRSCGRRPLGCMELLVGVWSMTTAVPYQGAGYTDLSSLDPLFYSTTVASDLVPSICEQECMIFWSIWLCVSTSFGRLSIVVGTCGGLSDGADGGESVVVRATWSSGSCQATPAHVYRQQDGSSPPDVLVFL